MTRSKEDYLKVMLGLSDGEGVRSSDIANALGITRASVSRMTEILKDEGYVKKEKYGAVALTEAGRSAAVNVKRRYDLLKAFLGSVLGLEAAAAAGDACRIEHIISSETTDKIGRRLEKLSKFKLKPEDAK